MVLLLVTEGPLASLSQVRSLGGNVERMSGRGGALPIPWFLHGSYFMGHPPDDLRTPTLLSQEQPLQGHSGTFPTPFFHWAAVSPVRVWEAPAHSWSQLLLVPAPTRESAMGIPAP